MVLLSEIQRMELFILIGYKTRIRTQENGCELLYNHQPDQSTPGQPYREKFANLFILSVSKYPAPLETDQRNPYKVHLMQKLNEDNFDLTIINN